MATDPHPDARAFLEKTAEAPDAHTLSPEEAREFQRSVSLPTGDPEPVGAVDDVVIRGDGHGVPLRVYTPVGDGPFPVLVWAHGGGWVLGDIETEDPTARALANATDCVVASVDYRLAPEHPFPAGLRDVFAAVEWAAEESTVEAFGGSAEHVAVGGSSAGGALAAGATHLARERGAPQLDYQVLVYPVTSYTTEFPSYEAYDGYFLSREGMAWNTEQYLADPLHGHNPLAFPLEADDFGGLPPASIVTAGLDMLRDEGAAYGEALADAGVEVTHHRYEDMVHTFFGKLQDPEWDRAREAVQAVGDDLRSAFDT